MLVQLHEAGGRLRMQELADRVLLHKSSITRLVDRMEAAGLVERVRVRGRRPQPLRRAHGRGSRHAALGPRRCTCAGVQRHFAGHLTDSDVVALARVFAKLPHGPSEA